ncbi:MAG: hypothetical protein A2X94_03350 [Bdellovibrionales bacterium GWB1_55_8]|nr:MAG: hypothetical protein A2X94_03350 [Bdellovibrionales bacterium GWB1_55_8]
MIFTGIRSIRILAIMGFFLFAQSAMAGEQRLFTVEDRNPGYYGAEVSLLTDASGNIVSMRIMSGGKEFMRESLVNFTEGQIRKKFFVQLRNDGFDRKKGGKLELAFSKQKVNLHIVKKGTKTKPKWIAYAGGKPLNKVRLSAKRLFGVIVGINDSVPVEFAKVELDTALASLSSSSAIKTAHSEAYPTDARVNTQEKPGPGDAAGSGHLLLRPSAFSYMAL